MGRGLASQSLAAPVIAAVVALVALAAAPDRPNIVLITADSLRADAVDYRPGGRTPALAALAARGTRFDQAFTVSPWTAPALVSIFSGLYPPTHGVVQRDDTTSASLPTLPRLLAAQGYHVANYGFFTGVSYYRNLGLPEPAISDPEGQGARALADWLPGAPEPFLAWLHSVEPHLPYGAGGYQAARVRVPGSSALEHAQTASSVPLGAGLTFAPGDAARVRALYADDVAQMDQRLALVFDALQRSGRAARTLVVFTADHGEELLEHGWIGHASTRGETHLTLQELQIPLVLAGPGVPAGQRSQRLAQNVDVTPTLLALLGLPALEAQQGVSLLPAFSGHAARSRFYVDSVPGGHLTPEARRGERIQAVGDGQRLHSERTGGPQSPLDPRAPALAPDLAAWQLAQSQARLGVLARHGDAVRPTQEEVERCAETLVVDAPADAARLDWLAASGTIAVAWQGPARRYWIEYQLGVALAGAFPVEEPRLRVGPFPRAFWNDLASYSPFRYRIVDPLGQTRSGWRSFTLVAAP